MSRRARLLAWGGGALVIAVAAAVALTLWLHRPQETAAADAVVATVPVGIAAPDLPKDTEIGVILTLGTSSSAGSEEEQAAQGAVVAAQRLKQGGNPITLTARNDRGTADGARQAVAELAEKGVSGLVIASTGDQAAAAAEAASEAGLPTILPYADPEVSGDTMFSTAPSAAAVKAATKRALTEAHSVLLVDAGGGTPAGVTASRTLHLSDFDDATALATEAAILTGDQLREPAADAGRGAKATRQKDPNDAVVLSADSQARAALITQALQARGVSAPIVLGPAATSPAFATALAEQDGAASGQLVSVGAAWGDAVALQSDDEGRAMSAFLSAVRLAAADDGVKNLTGDAPFADSAWAADARSHDAVIALVQAAARAESKDPAKVAEALRGSTPGAAEGLAGPALDFSGSDALTAPVSPVYASNQDLGLRPAGSGTQSLVWIQAPSGS